jgi:hypothetical protein
MLPFRFLWENINEIHSKHELPFNTNKQYREYDEELVRMIRHERDIFFDETLEDVQRIAEIMDGYNNDIDFTHRYKEEDSIEHKFRNQTITKKINKIANDILGMRFILKTDTETLQAIAQEFIQSCPNPSICSLADQTEGKKNDDGYKGIHIYIKPNNFVFPIEIQLWTRTHALLNEYLHDNIYKTDNHMLDETLKEHALELRSWLENVPRLPSDFGIPSYVDFLYERAK